MLYMIILLITCSSEGYNMEWSCFALVILRGLDREGPKQAKLGFDLE